MDNIFAPIRTDIVLQNETALLYHNYQDFLRFQHLYSSAVREIQTRLEVLNEEFSILYAHNPIHHVESRLKSTNSIIEKLRRKGCDISMESAKRNINDIAGIRVVCCYIDDVYRVEEMLLRQSDMELVKRQDYIAEPNYNGYRSLHLDLRVPIFLSDHTESVLAEVQIRTVAMDFWASLEHDIRYKKDKATLPAGINEQMLACADEIAVIDRKMQDMYHRIQAAE
ncbi:GTP pyrophosphokinase family protein [Oscillibacter valericigenes]|nr:GTP pyrophosphokinase family protein [Oscillibacter valericigenes]